VNRGEWKKVVVFRRKKKKGVEVLGNHRLSCSRGRRKGEKIMRRTQRESRYVCWFKKKEKGLLSTTLGRPVEGRRGGTRRKA